MQQHKFNNQIGLLNTMWSCLSELHPPFAYRFPSSYRCSSRDTLYSWARRVSTIKMWSFRKRLSELCLAAHSLAVPICQAAPYRLASYLAIKGQLNTLHGHYIK